MEYQHFFPMVNPDDPYLPSCYGIAMTTVQVGSKQRRVLLYMPRKARASTLPVTVLLPDGWTVERGLEETNWARLAEEDESRDKFVVMFLEPENGGKWNLDSPFGDPEGPAAYVDTAVDKIFGACKYVHADISRFGLIGYGAGGTAAQMTAMAYPAHVASVVSVGAGPVKPEYAKAAGDAICEKLAFYVFSGADKGIRNREVPVPTWIVDDPTACAESSEPSLRYWRETVGAEETGVLIAPDITAYRRMTPPPHPINQEQAVYTVLHSSIPGILETMGKDDNRRFWKYFLSRIHRIPGDPEGDLHIHRDPVLDCGCEYHYELIDGWYREWFTYVPDKVRKNRNKKVPLVVAIHGYGCSGDYYFNNVHWFKVAEERGFVLICPSGVNGGKYLLPTGEKAVMAPSWNQVADPDLPDEFVFFRRMIEITASQLPIDTSRVFATGHSNGSTTSHSLGLALPDVFAGLGCIGGAIPVIFHCVLERPEIVNRPNIKVPVWIFGGSEEPDIMPAYPYLEGENITADTINMWRKNDGLEPLSGEAWKEGWIHQGKYHDVVYSDGHMPMVRYTCVQDMPHAATNEMCYRLWDEFFSKISRGEDGEPHFQMM